MTNEIISTCPRCKEQLISTQLYCNNCQLELNANFSLSKFDCLSTDELNFVESFLDVKGQIMNTYN